MATPNPDEIYPKVKTYEEKQRDAHERELRRIARLPKHVYTWNILALGGLVLLFVAIVSIAPRLLSPSSTIDAISGVSFTFLLVMIWFFTARAVVLRMMQRFSALGYSGGGIMAVFYLMLMVACLYVISVFLHVESITFWLILLTCHVLIVSLLTRLVLR